METGIHSEIASNDWIPACAGMDGVNTRCLYVLMERATAITTEERADPYLRVENVLYFTEMRNAIVCDRGLSINYSSHNSVL